LHGKNGNNIVIGLTGGGRFPDLEIAMPDSISLAWLLRHMAAIGQGAFSPGIGAGIGCMMPCIDMDSPTKLRRNTEKTV
jgi:hypothetical protein